jgi:hypothetical protein
MEFVEVTKIYMVTLSHCNTFETVNNQKTMHSFAERQVCLPRYLMLLLHVSCDEEVYLGISWQELGI